MKTSRTARPARRRGSACWRQSSVIAVSAPAWRSVQRSGGPDVPAGREVVALLRIHVDVAAVHRDDARQPERRAASTAAGPVGMAQWAWITSALRARTVDYRSSAAEFPETMRPIVVAHALGEGPFSGDATRIKQRRIAQPTT